MEGLRLGEELAGTRLRVETFAHSPRLARTERGRRLVAAMREKGVSELYVTDEVMDSLGTVESPQGFCALALVPEQPPEAELGRVLAEQPLTSHREQAPAARPQPRRGVALVLDRIQDPGNVGTLVRTAEAFGAGPVVLLGGADPFGPKAVRASMGSILRHPVYVSRDGPALLRGLRARGFRLLAAGVRGGASLHRLDFLTTPTAVLIGSEAEGVAPELLDLVDGELNIPMAGTTESLNAAVAGSIVLYEAYRRGALKP